MRSGEDGVDVGIGVRVHTGPGPGSQTTGSLSRPFPPSVNSYRSSGINSIVIGRDLYFFELELLCFSLYKFQSLRRHSRGYYLRSTKTEVPTLKLTSGTLGEEGHTTPEKETPRPDFRQLTEKSSDFEDPISISGV